MFFPAFNRRADSTGATTSARSGSTSTCKASRENAFYFIANLHALTTVRDRQTLAQNTLDAAIDLLALGLDPDRATLFVQSDVPEVSELCWLLMTGTPMGLLERCHAYKDKKAKGLTADAGLFTYPVLMAADILIYDSDIVPVGEDQVQHIEVCRDLAASFNHQFGETFVLPKAKVLDTSARVPGTDGEKMSKSYGNTLEVFEEPKALRKQIMRIVTDSRPMEQPKEPGTDHLYPALLAVCRRRPARGDGRQVPARRLRLRRGEEGAGRPGRGLLRRGPRHAARELEVASRAGPRDPRRRRRHGPQESRRSAAPRPAGVRREVGRIRVVRHTPIVPRGIPRTRPFGIPPGFFPFSPEAL